MRWSKYLAVLVLGAFTVLMVCSGCGLESGGEIEHDGGNDSDGQSGTDGNGQVCQDDCPIGKQFCDGTGYRVCGNYDADACSEWSPQNECSSGTCEDGQCAGGCTDLCAALSKQCVGGGAYQTCADYNQDGCLEWGSQTPCDAGLICDEGYCVANCSNECAAGDLQCAAMGNGFESCDNHDTDSCLEFGGFTACSAYEICDSGVCLPDCSDECTLGQQRCVPGLPAFETCAANHDGDSCSEWGGQTNCGQDQICDTNTGQCYDPSQYPLGPYGTGMGDTIANECLERCKCNGPDLDEAEEFCLEEFLGSKAILISVATGW